MQSTNWPPSHCDALRDHLASGMSYSEIADAINAKFKTAYSRSAAIGRAKRMGLAEPNRAKDAPGRCTRLAPKIDPPRLPPPGEPYARGLLRPTPMFERAEPVKLRCVEIVPRHLLLLDLKPGDCRYPYGGDEEGEAITFCGHSRRAGSSYCVPHFHLTRGPGTAPERAASTVCLRTVEAA
jgi:GcrA cell cycle regulator